jgi:hypothetical protein
MYLLITGILICCVTYCKKSYESISGILASISTISKPSLFSIKRFKASETLEHVLTETKLEKDKIENCNKKLAFFLRDKILLKKNYKSMRHYSNT